MGKTLNKLSGLTLLSLCASLSYAGNWKLPPGHFIFEAGPYYADQGKSQDVAIANLVGDHFSVTDHHDWNGVFGVGYLFEGQKWQNMQLNYGVNAFYLAPTQVQGEITQEMLYTNLKYNYLISHLPIYATAKALFQTNYKGLTATVDLGLGPNFIQTKQYEDLSIDGGITIPDNGFKSDTRTKFSAMAGVGVRYQLKDADLELGYRFFYLGEGELKSNNPDILSSLKTGTNYAHALLLTVSV